MDTELVLPAFAALAILLFLTAAFTDIRQRRIPNWLCLTLACMGLTRIAYEIVTGGGMVEAGGDVAMAAVVLLLGTVLFASGWFGGGDVKLLTAGTLWLGLVQFGPFLYATVLAGGGLAVLFLLRRILRGRHAGGLHDKSDSLPYGVAIAAGGILVTTGLI